MGRQIFSVKSQIVNIFRFVDYTVFVTTTDWLLYCESSCGQCVHKWMWMIKPVGHSLQTPINIMCLNLQTYSKNCIKMYFRYIYALNKYLFSVNLRTYVPGTMPRTMAQYVQSSMPVNSGRSMIATLVEFIIQWGKTHWSSFYVFKCVRQTITLSDFII